MNSVSYFDSLDSMEGVSLVQTLLKHLVEESQGQEGIFFMRLFHNISCFLGFRNLSPKVVAPLILMRLGIRLTRKWEIPAGRGLL
jgi:hypothetical protein